MSTVHENKLPDLSLSFPSNRECNTAQASVQIHELEWYGPYLTRLTVTYERRCDPVPRMNMGRTQVRGCLHYEDHDFDGRPPPTKDQRCY